jgi:hypothetical protein
MRIFKGFTFLVGLICLIVGVAGLAWVINSRDVLGSGGASALGNIDLFKTVPASSVKNLDVHSDVGTIVFKRIDGDEIRAHFTGTVTDQDKNNWKLTASTSSDGTWTVEATNGSHFHIGLDFEQLLSLVRNGFTKQLVLEISLPNQVYDQIKVRTNTGKLELGDLQANVLEARADTGAIELDSFQGKELRLEADTGSIEFRNVQASGNVYAQTDTGRIHGSLKKLASPVTINTDTGSAALELPADSQASIELKTDVGRIGIDAPSISYEQKEKRHVQGKLGAGTYKVQIETDTGSTSLIAK